MSSTGEGSVTRWLGDLKSGGDAAAQHLWERYFQRLDKRHKRHRVFAIVTIACQCGEALLPGFVARFASSAGFADPGRARKHNNTPSVVIGLP